MAVTTQYSTEYTARHVNFTPNYGTERGCPWFEYFNHIQDGAGDSGSSVALVKLPPGRVRLILPASYFYCNWTTASATLDLGWDAYTDIDGDAVAADADGLLDGLSVDTADVYSHEELTTLAGLAATGWTKLFESKDGVTIRATSASTAIADADQIVGVFAFMKA